MNRIQKLLGWTMTVAGLVALAAPAQAMPGAARLAAVVDAERAAYGPEDGVAVRFELRNDSVSDLKVLAWRTPFAGFEADLFDVRRDGKPVAYLGRLVKRVEPTDADYLTIAAGDALETTFDLSKVYDMTAAGDYTVRFRPDALVIDGVREVADGKAFGLLAARVDSAEASFALVGDFEPRPTFAPEGFDDKVLAPGYSGCTSSQQSTLSTALSTAAGMATESYSYITGVPTASRSSNSRYTYWFGAYTSKNYSTVTNHFAAIKDALNNKKINFVCDCTDAGTYAYVYPTQPYNIHLCGAFWAAPMTGTDSKGGTLIHETSHFNVVAGTQDYAYGQAGCHKLALKTPRKAIANADCHEYYAEAGTP